MSWLMIMSATRDLWVAALLVLLVTLVVVMGFVSNELRKKLPPGPRPVPILGNLLQLKELPHQSLRALAARYGGLMYICLGSQPCIVVSTAAVAKELFQLNDAIFSSRPRRLFLTVFLGTAEYKNLVGAPYGPHWRQLRKLCNTELFSPRRQASYQKTRTEETHNMMRILLENSKTGKASNLKLWLYGATVNIMTRMLVNKRYFGNGIEHQQEREALVELTTRVLAAFSAFIVSDYVPWLSCVTWLQGWHTEFKALLRYYAEVTDKLFELEKRGEKLRQQKNSEDPDHVPDFVDVMLAAPLEEDGNPLSKQDIAIALMDILNGGSETSATTVEWAMAELASHPEFMKRAQDELEVVVGGDRVVEESDLPNLPFLQAIVKEAYRMHPAAPLALPRESTKPSKVMGYNLPARTQLILNLAAIHRDPSVYEDPDTFDPTRFVDHPLQVNPTSGCDSYELIPFSAGRRMCPAVNLGHLTVSLLLAHLLHSFDWSLPDGESAESYDMSETFGLTVHRKIPVSLIAHPKRPAYLY